MDDKKRYEDESANPNVEEQEGGATSAPGEAGPGEGSEETEDDADPPIIISG